MENLYRTVYGFQRGGSRRLLGYRNYPRLVIGVVADASLCCIPSRAAVSDSLIATASCARILFRSSGGRARAALRSRTGKMAAASS